MPWPPASTPPPPKPNAPPLAAVPSSDTLRQAALSASWARDRQVARRRIALRWLAWAWWRMGLPVLVVLALAVWLLGHIPPANVPAWFKPEVFSERAPVPNSQGLLPPASASPPSENALPGKEP